MKYIAAAFMVAFSTTQSSALTSYHIGNSLTLDVQPANGLERLASDGGQSLDAGYHICCGQPLTHMVESPDDVCVASIAPYGTYVPALTNYAFDVLTVQPFSGATPQQEYESAKTMIQMADAGVVYIYQAWASVPPSGTNFYDRWYDATAVSPGSDLIRNKAGFDWVYNELKNDVDLSGRTIRTIPVGSVLAELDLRMRNGEIAGFSSAADLYRDSLHMNNLGRFIAANTFYSVMFGKDPTGLPTNNYYATSPGQVNPIDITPELAALVQDAIWDVVSADHQAIPFAGDLNGDGFVGVSDLNIVLSAWNTDNSDVDQDGDHFVGISDLNVVLSNWNAGQAPSSVPEPSATLTLTLALVRTVGTSRSRSRRSAGRSQP